MNMIFTNLVAAGKVAIYLDDILIYTATPKKHHTVITQASEICDKLD